jgi:septal ring factor EnvC (AmiA/AmiB activator)
VKGLDQRSADSEHNPSTQGKHRKWCVGFSLCAWLLLPVAALADTKAQETETRLGELRTQIAALQKRMAQKTSESNALESQLRNADLRISALDKSLQYLEQSIAQQVAKLSTLTSEQQALQQELSEEQGAMDAELQNLWALQQGGGLKILFGDQSFDRLARNLAYYRRLLATRQESIQEFSALLDRVANNAEAIQNTQAQLAEQRETTTSQRRQLVALQASRRETLADIRQSLRTDTERKQKLEADAKQLAVLLQELRTTLEELDTPRSYVAFEKARGDMPMPVAGKVVNRYGAQKTIGDLRWRGWTIPAAEGAEIRAIHHGRVVYADWLRGQGLLMIIDHGGGYLSLYGHNRSLQREVGDWVAPGDAIATVGSSGGAEYPGLYFEIRHDGEPVNPGVWIKR